MFNKVILVGNTTRDIDLRYSQSGSAVAKVGIATSRKFKSATGEPKVETMFIDLTFFGRSAEVAKQYLRKGSKILVEGRLILEQWVAQDGSKRSRHSITVESMKMLDTRVDNNQQQSNSNNSYNATPQNQNTVQQQPVNAPQQNTSQQPNIPEIDIDEDEIPF